MSNEDMGPTIDARDVFLEDSQGTRESVHNIMWMILNDLHELSEALMNENNETVH